MVNPVGIGLLCDDRIDDLAGKDTAELAHIGWIDVAMQDARYVVTAVNGYELTAQGITVTMFEKNLLAYPGRFGTEVHSYIFAVESETRKGNAMDIRLGTKADCRRIGNDGLRVVVCLLRIVELKATHLGGRLYAEEGMFAVGDDK